LIPRFRDAASHRSTPQIVMAGRVPAIPTGISGVTGGRDTPGHDRGTMFASAQCWARPPMTDNACRTIIFNGH
jgi:hypothetical protein